jgi:murein DD-endopeptidase MepM/ murein hydrolase activator NlpD
MTMSDQSGGSTDEIGAFDPATSQLQIFQVAAPPNTNVVQLTNSISVGPDGAIWFTEVTRASNGTPFVGIGRITTSGTASFYPDPDPNGRVDALGNDDSGQLWFTSAGGVNFATPTLYNLDTANPSASVAYPVSNLAAGLVIALANRSAVLAGLDPSGTTYRFGIFTSSTPPPSSTPRFLRLPFDPATYRSNMKLVTGFMMVDPLTKKVVPHYGIDYALLPPIAPNSDNHDQGQPFLVRAGYAGEACYTPDTGSGYGNTVVIHHTVNGNLYTSLYAHLANQPASPIQNTPCIRDGKANTIHVTAGQNIGTAGHTGTTFNSTGNPPFTHLHFQFCRGSDCISQANAVDPYDLNGLNNKYPSPDQQPPQNVLGANNYWATPQA